MFAGHGEGVVSLVPCVVPGTCTAEDTPTPSQKPAAASHQLTCQWPGRHCPGPPRPPPAPLAPSLSLALYLGLVDTHCGELPARGAHCARATTEELPSAVRGTPWGLPVGSQVRLGGCARVTSHGVQSRISTATSGGCPVGRVCTLRARRLNSYGLRSGEETCLFGGLVPLHRDSGRKSYQIRPVSTSHGDMGRRTPPPPISKGPPASGLGVTVPDPKAPHVPPFPLSCMKKNMHLA